MANAFDTYTPGGPPVDGRVRRAATWDLGLVTVAFMVLWPSPAMRLTLGLPWSVHIPLMLGSLAVVWWLYSVMCAALLRRTVGMYIADLGFARPADAVRASVVSLWALGWAAALVPAALGARGPADAGTGWAARLSGLALASTRESG
jgi:hypothetical protein